MITPQCLLAALANQRLLCTTAAKSLVVVLLASLQVYSAYADDKSAALTVITDTADKLCGFVATQGEAHSSKVSGNVQTQLSGLARYLASIGVSGAGEITSSSYQNVLQQDLATALRDVRDCKLKVFGQLVEIVFSTPPQHQGSNTVPGVPGREIGIQIIRCKIGSDEVTTGVSGNNMLTTTNYGSAKVYSQSREWGTITRQNDPNCPAILYTSSAQSSRFCISTKGKVSVLGSGIWVGNCEICDTARNCYTPQIP